MPIARGKPHRVGDVPPRDAIRALSRTVPSLGGAVEIQPPDAAHAQDRGPLDPVARKDRLAARERSKPLTPREYEVLRLISLGLTYVRIGERLSITERTARAHLVAVKEKLGATNNAQAVTRGFERGLLREDD